MISDEMSVRAASATSSIARSNAASFAFEGFEKPLSFLTNCKEDARISSSVAGGSKLKSVLMFRHMVPPRREMKSMVILHRLLNRGGCRGARREPLREALQ